MSEPTDPLSQALHDLEQAEQERDLQRGYHRQEHDQRLRETNDLAHRLQQAERERDELRAIVTDKSEVLLQAEHERDEWKAEAEHRRALNNENVRRLELERDEARATGKTYLLKANRIAAELDEAIANGADYAKRATRAEHNLQEIVEERDEAIDLIEDIHWQLQAPVQSASGTASWLQDALKVLWKHGRLKVEAGDAEQLDAIRRSAKRRTPPKEAGDCGVSTPENMEAGDE